MTSPKPYLVRAFFDWILDNILTPYIVVNALKPNVHVPKNLVQNDQIIFNVTPGIVEELEITNDYIRFKARFTGVKQEIYFPISAVTAIYAKENGRGMAFDPADDAEEGSDDNGPSKPDNPPTRQKPKLTVVK